MEFEFATATRIIFGPGKRHELPGAVAGWGERALLVTGARPDRAEWVRKLLPKAELASYSVPGEPSIERVVQGAALARETGARFVIAVGGGSVLDGGKAIAALTTNTGPVLEYLEVIGPGKPLTQNPLPFVAIPTTAGTGTEVTRNAVLSSPEHRVKVSLRSPKMLPALAIVDPELTWDLPRALTASTGFRHVPIRSPMRSAAKAFRAWLAPCHELLPTPEIGRREATWHWAACSADLRWPMRDLARCTASPRRLAGCSPRRTARFARRCCRTRSQ
jgi:hypothetical protein